MTETDNEPSIESLVGPADTWRVIMGTPRDHTLKVELDVEAHSDVGAYWAAVAAKPDMYAERIFPSREAL